MMANYKVPSKGGQKIKFPHSGVCFHPTTPTMGSEEGQMLPVAAPPLDDENLLSEILLRLPPQPSSLPCASTICKRWRSLVSDRGFIRRFRLHHRGNPPLLGLFRERAGSIHLQPTMEPPNRVPHGHFSSPINDSDGSFKLVGCRHGLVLIFDYSRDQILVWDPVTGEQHRFAPPPEFGKLGNPIDGTVIRAAGDAHHFQVVLVVYEPEQNPRAAIFFYSSENAVWNILISTPVPGDALDYAVMPPVLVGDSLYWMFHGNSSAILEVNLDRQRVAVTPVPMDMFAEGPYCDHLMVMRAEGGLGILSLSDYTIQLWKRNTNCASTAPWLLRRNIDLDTLLHLNSQQNISRYIMVIAYAEENNVAFLRTCSGIFMVQLESLQFRKIIEDIPRVIICYPFESVYAAETGIGGEHDGADQDMLV
uniref:Uncharacterized protein n=1 Tax=Avena sativa TaxID=4498 RepID=A0ACD5Z823_AVESA